MSHNDLLRIQNLKVCAGEKEILHGIDLDIHENVHVMGPNGTGKSTLGAALMGNPAYTVTGGDIIYKGTEHQRDAGQRACQERHFPVVPEPHRIRDHRQRSIRSALEAKTGKRIRLFSFKKSWREDGTAPDGSVLCRT
ncbi:MAG: ATP-binding cassette domain-containing protein [Ruminococcus sp.]